MVSWLVFLGWLAGLVGVISLSLLLSRSVFLVCGASRCVCVYVYCMCVCWCVCVCVFVIFSICVVYEKDKLSQVAYVLRFLHDVRLFLVLI